MWIVALKQERLIFVALHLNSMIRVLRCESARMVKLGTIRIPFRRSVAPRRESVEDVDL